jgi:hypothetical protein
VPTVQEDAQVGSGINSPAGGVQAAKPFRKRRDTQHIEITKNSSLLYYVSGIAVEYQLRRRQEPSHSVVSRFRSGRNTVAIIDKESSDRLLAALGTEESERIRVLAQSENFACVKYSERSD